MRYRLAVLFKLATCAVAMTPVTARADFKLVEQSTRKVVPPADTCSPGVANIEGFAGSIRVLVVPGGHEPAASALRDVLPYGWTMAGEHFATAEVDWSGGSRWLDIVDHIARSANLCITVDYEGQHLAIRPATSPAQPRSVPVSEKAMASVEKGKSVSAAPAPAVKTVVLAPAQPTASTASLDEQRPVKVIAPPAPVYVLEAGSTVRKTLARWTKDAGWQLVWHSEYDYPIAVDMSFPVGTTFEEALRTLLKAYWHQSYAIEGRMYANRVLEIVGRSQ